MHNSVPPVISQMADTSNAKPRAQTLPSFSTVACIGTGLSGIALGAQLKRWYDFDDIQFFERHSTYGGTWWVNKYPGALHLVDVIPQQ